MGKRELLLIVAFAIAGLVVYQFTAPPPAAGERSFSPGRILENIRRGVRGNRASAETVNTTTHPVDPAATDLQLSWPGGTASELTIVGEDRGDIASELKVRSRAYDEPEAQRTANATVFRLERVGPRLTGSVDFPREGSQTATLTLRVPSRLRVKLDAARSRTRVSNVAAVQIGSGRGESEIRQVKGSVEGSYRGGELRVMDVGSVKFTTIGTDVRLDRVRGETSMNMRAGDFRGGEIVGPIDIDATGIDLELEGLEKTTGTMRITASAGSVSVKGIRVEARIDARNADVDAIIDRPAPVSIYSEGGSAVEITPPPGGYQLDAVATDGQIELPEGTLQVTSSGSEHRATGAVKGGGPTITIRTQHGSVTVRER